MKHSANHAPPLAPASASAPQAKAGTFAGRLLAALVAGGLIVQALSLAADLTAARAARALDEGNPQAAARLAEAALSASPWHDRAAFTRCMAQRAQGSAQLSDNAEAAAAWHPQRGLLLLIAGEARLQHNQPALAARDLWEGLWTAPAPARDAAIFWREAWQAEQLAPHAKKMESAARQTAARGMLAGLLAHAELFALNPEARQAFNQELAAGAASKTRLPQ